MKTERTDRERTDRERTDREKAINKKRPPITHFHIDSQGVISIRLKGGLSYCYTPDDDSTETYSERLGAQYHVRDQESMYNEPHIDECIDNLFNDFEDEFDGDIDTLDAFEAFVTYIEARENMTRLQAIRWCESFWNEDSWPGCDHWDMTRQGRNA